MCYIEYMDISQLIKIGGGPLLSPPGPNLYLPPDRLPSMTQDTFGGIFKRPRTCPVCRGTGELSITFFMPVKTYHANCGTCGYLYDITSGWDIVAPYFFPILTILALIMLTNSFILAMAVGVVLFAFFFMDGVVLWSSPINSSIDRGIITKWNNGER